LNISAPLNYFSALQLNSCRNGADTKSGGSEIDAIIALGGNDSITAGNFGTLNIADNAVDGVSCVAEVDTVYIGPNENDVPPDNDGEAVIIRP
jgi:hypothetical protein